VVAEPASPESPFSVGITQLLKPIVLLLACFPYVHFGLDLGLDTQPWFFLAALMLFFLGYRLQLGPLFFITLAVVLAVVLGSLLSALTNGVIEGYWFFTGRGLYSYLTLLLGIAVFSAFGPRDLPLVKRILQLSIVLYLFCGFIQWVGLSDLAFLSVNRTTDNRGVTSLAAEPSFFGVLMFFLLLAYRIVGAALGARAFGDRAFELVAVLGLIVLSESAVAVVLLAIFYSGRLFWLMIPAALLLVWALNAEVFGDGSASRGLRLLVQLGSVGVVSILSRDASVNERLSSVFGPYLGSLDGYGFPGGFFEYRGYFLNLLEQSNFFFWGSGQIHSFFGAPVFEGGVFGWIFLLTVAWLIFRAPGLRFTERLAALAGLHMALPLNVGLVPLLLCLCTLGRPRRPLAL
jgi:hypothetical protein